MAFPKEIADFMAKYGVLASELWEVRRGGAYAIKHKALERVARAENITFAQPTVLYAEDKSVALLVTGYRQVTNPIVQWATGEASPDNNKNAYPWAMAEKRGKDRVILKLLESHGDIYSEDEADDFKQPRQNPHVTRAADLHPLTDKERAELPPTPRMQPPAERTRMVDGARERFRELGIEMMDIREAGVLKEWWLENLKEIEGFPGNWPEMFVGRYEDHLHDLEAQEKAA